MSRGNRGQKLKRDIVRSEKEDYDELQEQYANGEINDREFEQGVENLLDSGDEFLEYEETTSDKAKDAGRSLKQKLAYYSLPLTIIAAFAIPILLPNVSPMVAIVAAPTIFTVAVIVWGYFKLRSITSDW